MQIILVMCPKPLEILIALCTLACTSCSDDVNEVEVTERKIHESLVKIHSENSNLGYGRLAKLQSEKKNLFVQIGFLPYYIQFFENFKIDDVSPSIEIKVSLLQMNDFRSKHTWEMHISESVILPQEIKNVTPKDLKLHYDEFSLIDVVFTVPISEFSNLEHNLLIILSGNKSCFMHLDDKIKLFNQQRALAISAGDPVIEMQIPINSERIAIQNKHGVNHEKQK